MTHAIRFHETGSPDVLKYESIDPPPPGPGEARVRHSAIGVNFIDTYHRTGLYKVPLPSGIGKEGAGIVEAVGEGVTVVTPGDRVVYCDGPLGSYASERNLPASVLIKLPQYVSEQHIAAGFLRAMTVEYLLNRTYKCKAGDTILFHAAAGGVGLIAAQWCRAIGVNMIGTVGSDDKGKLALEHGCKHVINYNSENFVERVKEITGGKKVPVVYDSVGKDTWPASLDCLQPLGLMVSFGNSSGPVTGVDLGILAAKGSLYVTRQTLMAYTSSRATTEEMANNVFNMMKDSKIDLAARQTYSLADAAQAHRDLEARKTVGGVILVP
ncbi:MAG TPA: quinone oxidoreductase [Casimicrobium huifangae]|jgi:NADPH2:quinone reductase|uniref:quinone oxidoreductase family protein n=1 Tax=Casimicrobium huifangae TaxID=2591109 RepID=UPI002C508C58|nr:quinone oxidoreductase [Casimicrobium huifangae]HQD65533.1 quinone oxidoreductase [Casimicrobium huifangae]